MRGPRHCPPMPAATKPPLPKSVWEQIKLAAVAGVPWQRICDTYGVSRDALRKAALRQNWPVPTRMEHQQRRAGSVPETPSDLSHSRLIHHETRENPPLSAIELAQKSAKDVAYASSARLVHRAASKLDSWEIPTPGDMREGAQLLGIMHKAALIEARATAPQVQVNVAVGSWGGPVDVMREA
jgi:hypothetical protein